MAIKKRIVDSETTTLNSTKPYNNNKIEILKPVLTGMSYMVVVMILYSIVRVLEQLIPVIFLGVTTEEQVYNLIKDNSSNEYKTAILSITYLLKQFKEILYQLASPVLAGFISHAIGGKIALILGFTGGFIANNPIIKLSIMDGQLIKHSFTPSGFIGSIIVGIFVGYLVKYLNKNIKLRKEYLAFKVNLLVPSIGLFVMIFTILFIINPIVGAVGVSIESIIRNTSEYGEYVYSIFISIFTVIDLGGPINKSAGLVSMGFLVEGIYPVTARTLSVVIPSIGIGISTIIDKYIVKRRVYSDEMYATGKNTLLLALMGISEGAIPFAIEKPMFVIPINIIGSLIGSLTAIFLGAHQEFPDSAIWAWAFVENKGAYIIGIIVGSMFIAISNILYRNYLINKKEKRKVGVKD